MAKPVFVLLHGAWHTPRCWSRLVSKLDQAGYESVAPVLSSSGSSPPTPGFDEDVDTIRGAISDLIEMQRDVVVVMHSFSGMTGGTALDGLDKESRVSKNLSGGVIRLIYVVAFIVPEGFQHSSHGTRENMSLEMKTDFEAGTITVHPKDAKNFFYQDIPDEDVVEFVKDLQPQSLGAFWSTTTHAAWRYIPTTYIICTADVPSTVAAAQYLVDSAKASGVHMIDNVVKVDAGHFPFISKPQWTARLFIEEASRIVQTLRTELYI